MKISDKYPSKLRFILIVTICFTVTFTVIIQAFTLNSSQIELPHDESSGAIYFNTEINYGKIIKKPVDFDLTDNELLGMLKPVEVSIPQIESSYEEPVQEEICFYEEPVSEEISFYEAKIYYEIPVSHELQDGIKVICDYYGFDSELIYQIMYCESRFQADNITGDCLGAMQIHKKYYKYSLELEDDLSYIYKKGFDPFDMIHNVLAAVRFLDEIRTECMKVGYEGIKPILECYNKGIYGFMTLNPTYRYSEIVLAVEIKIEEEK